ncbi:MAG: hypothetical protein H7061_06125 [Bdellovibrionaceae bacterium]|nr:hypothetical protein [Bdellovibrio sp.]
MDLVHYDCITAAGLGPQALIKGLIDGRDFSVAIQGNEWRQSVPTGGRVCFIPRELQAAPIKERTYQEAYEDYLDQVWNRFYKNLAVESQLFLKKSKVLILFSSTKGIIEDYIWDYADSTAEARFAPDPFFMPLHYFKKKNLGHFGSADALVISNACASSHIALQVAKANLELEIYEAVIVIAADLIGPFIYQGFLSLKVMSPTRNKPFSADRDGLQLGEALAILLLTKHQPLQKNIKISNVTSDTEGGSVTRPSMNGESLYRALKKLNDSNSMADFYVAHGTGTRFNDASEEAALIRYDASDAPTVGIKWSIGHTLGASGALDLITACEMMKSKKLFYLENTLQKDQTFKKNYLTKKLTVETPAFCRAVVTSLGFGGVHAALQVEAPR